MSFERTAGEPTWQAVLSEPVRLDILQALAEMEEATAAELSAAIHVSDSTLRKQLDWLTAMRVVREHRTERDGVTPGRPATRFSVDPTVRTNVRRLLDHLGRSPFQASPSQASPGPGLAW